MSKKYMVEGGSLPEITDQEYDFIEALLFDRSLKGSAAGAYDKAYKGIGYSPRSRNELASRKRNDPRIVEWIRSLRSANLDRLVCTLEEHLSELAKLREEAREDKQYAAAINAELRRGQAAGLYVDRKEITHKSGDDISKLVSLSRSGKHDVAATYAKELGVESDFRKALKESGVTIQ